jgi:hypothetical protein
MRSEELERRADLQRAAMGPGRAWGQASYQGRAAGGSGQDRLGSPGRGGRGSHIGLIYDKVVELKDAVRSFADHRLAPWPLDPGPLRLSHKNTLHSYVERERETIKLMNTRNSFPSPGQDGISLDD